MLAQGYTFNRLFGKDNPQTTELRFIEQIVGSMQSFYSGHISKHNFNPYIGHLGFNLSDHTLNVCLAEIKSIIDVGFILRCERK